jgi:hypothetical protein
MSENHAYICLFIYLKYRRPLSSKGTWYLESPPKGFLPEWETKQHCKWGTAEWDFILKN